MKSPLTLAALAALSLQSLPAQSLLLGRNLFPEGTFDIFGESKITPSGWSFPDQNDIPWRNGFRVETVKGASGSRELRMTNPTPGFTAVDSRVMLPAKIERLRINYRILAKKVQLGEPDPAGNGAGIYVRFHDATDKYISGGWVGGQVKATDAEWQEREHVFDVPAKAASLRIQVVFRSAEGEVRVDDIEVVPVSMSE